MYKVKWKFFKIMFHFIMYNIKVALLLKFSIQIFKIHQDLI